MSLLAFDGPDLNRRRVNSSQPEVMVGVNSSVSLETSEMEAEEAASSPEDLAIDQLEQEIRDACETRSKKIARTKEARRAVQRETEKLEQALSTYKSVLVKAGRDGKWSAFLKTVGLAKSTADRYVARFRERGAAKGLGKLLSEDITEAELQALAKRCCRTVRSKLRNAEQRQSFIRLLSLELLNAMETSVAAEAGKLHPSDGQSRSNGASSLNTTPEARPTQAVSGQPFTEDKRRSQ